MNLSVRTLAGALSIASAVASSAYFAWDAGGAPERVAEQPHSAASAGPRTTDVPSDRRAGRGLARPSSTAPLPITQDDRSEGAPGPSDPGLVDPEAQPRTFLAIDFRTGAGLAAGAILAGIVRTPSGFELAAPPIAYSSGRRAGSVTSRPIELEFPANAITPLWKAELPEGTDLVFEISPSYGGVEWGDWHAMSPDVDSNGDIAPTYPDGSPNPNHGFAAGGILIAGRGLWTHVRYRITLSSSSAATPRLSMLRFFYQDTTLGMSEQADPEDP